jgi:hypothetical protein
MHHLHVLITILQTRPPLRLSRNVQGPLPTRLITLPLSLLMPPIPLPPSHAFSAV